MNGIEEFGQSDVVRILRGTELVMLTTALRDGALVSHPMTIQEVSDDVDVLFFVGLDSGHAEALRQGSAVNLAVAEGGTWLSVAGKAVFEDDRARIRSLWTDAAEAYFPEGPEDENLGLLRFSGDSAQYWGVPGGKVAAVAQIVRARLTGDRPAGGTATTDL